MLRRGNQIFKADIAVADTLSLATCLHLNVNARHIPAFTWDNQQGTTASRLYERLFSYIRKVCDGKNIHDAPRLVSGITLQFQPHGTANRTARTITADQVARFHDFTGFGYITAAAILTSVTQCGSDGMRVTRGDCQAVQPAIIVGLQAMRRTLHYIQIHVMHPRLVQNHMRHLR